jgi:imidazoleglycerol-phosphate dehydratase
MRDNKGNTTDKTDAAVSGAKNGQTDGSGQETANTVSAAAKRQVVVARKTGETDIALELNVDGTGKVELESGVPFLNHMLDLFAKHGQFDLKLQAEGDIDVDDHHTVEDIAICLGQALREALGNKVGIKRYASVFIPMDEALAQVIIDVSNRPHLEYRAEYPSAQIGSFQTELVHEFLWKLALEARITLHVIVHYGRNTHHMVEAVFKALGRALDEATTIDPRVKGVPSTKGVL